MKSTILIKLHDLYDDISDMFAYLVMMKPHVCKTARFSQLDFYLFVYAVLGVIDYDELEFTLLQKLFMEDYDGLPDEFIAKGYTSTEWFLLDILSSYYGRKVTLSELRRYCTHPSGKSLDPLTIYLVPSERYREVTNKEIPDNCYLKRTDSY